jgi:hypothetical protein
MTPTPDSHPPRKDILDELADCRRRALCAVLDALGADGVYEWHTGTPPDGLMHEITEHVRWMEVRARRSALTDAAKKAGEIAAAAEAAVVVSPSLPLAVDGKAEGARLCERAILEMRQQEEE